MFEALGKALQAAAVGDANGFADALRDAPPEEKTSMRQGCGSQLTTTDGGHMFCTGHDEKGKCTFEPATGAETRQ